MRTINLPKDVSIGLLYALPAGGWFLWLQEYGGQSYYPAVVRPDAKEPFYYTKRGMLNSVSYRNTRLCVFCPSDKTSRKRVYIDQYGMPTPDRNNAMPTNLLHADPKPPYAVHHYLPVTHLDNDIGEESLAQVAAGLSDGGIIIWRCKDRKHCSLAIPGNLYDSAFSRDYNTVLLATDNMIYIIDNPLAID